MSILSASKALRRRVDYSIDGLARPNDIEAVMTSSEFRQARTLEAKRQVIARWLRQRRLEKGYVVGEIDRKHRPFSDKAAAEYGLWDIHQAETILERARG